MIESKLQEYIFTHDVSVTIIYCAIKYFRDEII